MRVIARDRVSGSISDRMMVSFERAVRSFATAFSVPILEPAFVYSGLAASVRPIEPHDSLISRPLMFHTGPAPHKASPEGKVMGGWKLEPEGPGQPVSTGSISITYAQAQRAIARLLKSEFSCHQYLTFEAAKLLTSDPQVERFTLHLVTGALAEDYVFREGEGVKDIVAGDSSLLGKISRTKLSAFYPDRVINEPHWLTVPFKWIAKWYNRIVGNDHDELNRPYLAHFYNGAHGLRILEGQLEFQNAADRIASFWEDASQQYQSGNLSAAFYSLGHLVHLVQDLHVPAHVHNDMHGPTLILGQLDSFEVWTCKADYPAINRTKGEPNVRIWNSKPLTPPKAQNWQSAIELRVFIDEIVRDTQRFRSVDAMGNDDFQRALGELSDEECYEQGKYLIPMAIQRSAQVIANFLEYQRQQSQRQQSQV